jgi:hypothetical protein
MVATCGDDGTARLWYPLKVFEFWLVSVSLFPGSLFRFCYEGRN